MAVPEIHPLQWSAIMLIAGFAEHDQQKPIGTGEFVTLQCLDDCRISRLSRAMIVTTVITKNVTIIAF